RVLVDGSRAYPGQPGAWVDRALMVEALRQLPPETLLIVPESSPAAELAADLAQRLDYRVIRVAEREGKGAYLLTDVEAAAQRTDRVLAFPVGEPDPEDHLTKVLAGYEKQGVPVDRVGSWSDLIRFREVAKTLPRIERAEALDVLVESL